jgi:hypothetical protein
VIATLVLSVSYYAIAWSKCGDCDHKKLGWIAVTGLGGVTGVFIFIGCFEVMKVSVLNGVWSGIAGIIITLATMTEIIKNSKGSFSNKSRRSGQWKIGPTARLFPRNSSSRHLFVGSMSHILSQTDVSGLTYRIPVF